MAAIRLADFHGLNTHADERKGPFHALEAVNVDVDAKSLKPVLTLNTGAGVGLTYTGTIYHLDAALAIFLQWPGEVHVARSPTGPALDDRVVYTGDGVPRITDLTLATCGAAGYTAPAKSYVLGIPLGQPIRNITNTGGSGVVEDRAYVWTWVSPWGEEGPPSTPVTVSSFETGASVQLEGIGVATRRVTGSPSAPTGLELASVTFVGAPTPGFMEFVLTNGVLHRDVNPGDRVYIGHNTQALGNQSYIVSEVAGSYFRAIADCWPVTAGSAVFVVPPVNSINVYSVANLFDGRVRLTVNTVEGLRVGESLTFSGATGMTDLNGTFLVEEIAPGPVPTIVIALSTTQVYDNWTARGVRTAPHNSGEVRISSMSLVGTTATLGVESTAHIDVDDYVMVMGLTTAYQLNGVRKVLAVRVPDQIDVESPAVVGAYVAGTGLVMMPIPYAFQSWGVSAIAAAGGGAYPTPFTRVITLDAAHDFVVNEQVLGYDIGGAVELNTVMVVSAIGVNTITVSLAQAGAAYTSGGRIARVTLQAKKRIYRTAQGNAGAEYQLVAEIGADKCRYTDTIESTALGAILETDGYIQPPTDLHSIVAHPNGMLQALSGNIFCQTPAYRPHAWPIALQRTIPADAKALSIFDTTAVVFTNDMPYLFSGFDPESQRPERVIAEAYMATGTRGHAITPFGIAYRGRTGIWMVGKSGPENLTRGILRDEDFTATGRTALAYWAGRVMWYEGDVNGASVEGYAVSLRGSERTLTQWETAYPVRSMHLSPLDSKLYMAYHDGLVGKRAIYQDFAATSTPARYTYKTQLIQLPRPILLAWLQVIWDWQLQSTTLQAREDALGVRMRAIAASAANKGALNGLTLNGGTLNGGGGVAPIYSPDITLLVPTERYLRLTVVAEPGTANERVVFDDFVVGDEPVRMSGGVKAHTFQVTAVGNGKVSSIGLASTLAEIRSV